MSLKQFATKYLKAGTPLQKMIWFFSHQVFITSILAIPFDIPDLNKATPILQLFTGSIVIACLTWIGFYNKNRLTKYQS
ncbi:hypothetical protein [Vibrio sp. 10N.239.312.D08]|uniref:hypothetical protein n=1 Tax=Vibrio sp. 10N.239.312.D08 TaxID=3229978 RepID=UPI00355235E8